MSLPQRIGKYEILRKLGEGATSVVYLARDDFAQRDVALKSIFPAVLGDPEKGRQYRHLLLNEASLAGKLNHPHIVQIFDAVIEDRAGYIVMEYVPGGTLEPFSTPDKLLPIDRVVEIIFKCTRALDFANRLGVTHRDIKPANILLATQEAGGESQVADIKISDFGAALVNSGDQTQTQVAGVGSPAYMSPQQVRDQPLNHQTDIYSLGVVTYQLLTGRLPFQAGTNYAMIYQICNAEPPPPSTFRTDVPATLDAIVARAMQKELDARYQTWEEFAHDLAQAFRSKQLTEKQRNFPDSEKFESLRGLEFFAGFSDVDLWEVVRFSRWEVVAPGTVIMRDGEPGNSFAFLLAGEVLVSKSGVTLDRLEIGACFGEMAVVRRHERIRGADVTATTNAKLVLISGAALRHASDTCRMHFYQAFLGVVANRLDSVNLRLASL